MIGDAGSLLFSDIPNNRILRWTPDVGVTTCRQPLNYTNGHTRDRLGRLGWRVTRTATCGSRPGTGCIAEHPGGSLPGKILVPEIVSNGCLGGRAKHQLYITVTTGLYMVALNRRGVQQP